MYEELKLNTFVESVSTDAVERLANSRTGHSFFLETDHPVYGWSVHEMRWDSIDYMAVVRQVSNRAVGSHYTHFAVLETTSKVNEQLKLANRGKRSLHWEDYGVITAIYFGKSQYDGHPRIPQALDGRDPGRLHP